MCDRTQLDADDERTDELELPDFQRRDRGKNNYGSYGATFYVKLVQDDSKLGLCGMYLLDASAAFGQGVQNAFSDDRSWISVDGRKVATLAFLPGHLPNTPDSNRRAARVRTETTGYLGSIGRRFGLRRHCC